MTKQEDIDRMNAERDMRRKTMTYQEACHAIQSGVLQMMHVQAQQDRDTNTHATGPKHLRTGINIAMCDHAALVNLLVKKGLFTMEEYQEEIRLAAITEVEMYENQLMSHYRGRRITLI